MAVEFFQTGQVVLNRSFVSQVLDLVVFPPSFLLVCKALEKGLREGYPVVRLILNFQGPLPGVRLGRLLRTLCGQYKILRGSSSRRELNLGLG